MPGPTYRLHGAFVLQLWHQVLRHADSSVYLESLWRPESEQTFALRGPLAATTDRRNVELAWGGLQYLIRTPAVKRGRQSRKANWADLEQSRKDAAKAADLLESGVSRKNVAARFNVHPSTIDRRVKWAKAPDFIAPEESE